MKKTVSVPVFVAALTTSVLAAFPALATVTIQSRIDPGSDHKWVKPIVRIYNDQATPINLNGMTINYYFNDSKADLNALVTQIFYSSQLPPRVTDSRYDTDLSFKYSRLPQGITGANGKYANAVCQVRIVGKSKTISNAQFYELQFGFHTPNWYVFNEGDDWSYLNNITSFTPTTAISLVDTDGNILAGLEPVTSLFDVLSDATSHIQHIIVIMQENRSFDNYFGSYGYDMCPTSYCDQSGRSGNNFAEGILDGAGMVKPEILQQMPTGTYSCTDATGNTTTLSPPARFPASIAIDGNFPHVTAAALAEMDRPADPTNHLPLAIKPFIDQALDPNVLDGGPGNCPNINQIIGYHSGKNSSDELYQYWQFAKNFVLEDHMFEPVKSWSPVSHLYMVSAYTADSSCIQSPCPYQQYGNYDRTGDSFAEDHPWESIADVLRGNATWKFYEGNGWNYNCQDCNKDPATVAKNCVTTSDTIYGFWSPLKDFTSVKANECKDTASCSAHVGNLKTFYNDVAAVTQTIDNFPAVSWIVPGAAVSEHGGFGQIRWGVSYVTSIIQAIMRNPRLWDTTAIFLSWDDWGGFYDHFVTKSVDYAGWGLRVPGLLISKWAQYGFIDKDYYSHDAYLRLIEDRFAGGTRIAKNADGTSRDGRPTNFREEASFTSDPYGGIGDLLNEFYFDESRTFIDTSALRSMKCYVSP